MTQMRAKGTDGQIEFDGSTVLVHRKGMSARLSHGSATREIPIADLLRVDYKHPTALFAGHIRFAVPGEIGDKPTNDRNAVIFQKWHLEEFDAIHAAVTSALDARGPLSVERIATITADRELAATLRMEALLSKVTPAATYGAHVVNKGQYSYAFGSKRPIAGAVAEFESGADRSRPTLTRIGAGALIAGPVGAIAGGMFKKDKSKGYVTITFPDGAYVIVDGPSKDEKKLRAFANSVNTIGASEARSAMPSAPAADESGSPADRLLKLKELQEAGVLTDEQYAEKAAPLIAQL